MSLFEESSFDSASQNDIFEEDENINITMDDDDDCDQFPTTTTNEEVNFVCNIMNRMASPNDSTVADTPQQQGILILTPRGGRSQLPPSV